MHNLIRINAFGSALNDGLLFPLNGPLCWPNIDVTPDTVNWVSANATLPDGPWVNAEARITGISNPIEIFYDYQAGSIPTTVLIRISNTSIGTNDFELNPASWIVWSGGSFNAKTIQPNQYVGIAVDEIDATGTLRVFNLTDFNKLLDTIPYVVATLA